MSSDSIDPAAYPIKPESPTVVVMFCSRSRSGFLSAFQRRCCSIVSMTPSGRPTRIAVQTQSHTARHDSGHQAGARCEPGNFMMGGWLHTPVPAHQWRKSYRSMRTNLAFARARENLKTLVLTSPGPADGKSTTARISRSPSRSRGSAHF